MSEGDARNDCCELHGERRFVSRSPEETWRLAAQLEKCVSAGTVIALHGELGSGKTCFTQGFAQSLGVAEPVTSPTFTMVNEHEGRLPLFHVDLYRAHRRDELESLNLFECFSGKGVTIVEWADRAADMMPADAIHVYFETLPEPDSRRITIRRIEG